MFTVEGLLPILLFILRKLLFFNVKFIRDWPLKSLHTGYGNIKEKPLIDKIINLHLICKK